MADTLSGPLLASYYDRRNPQRRVTAEGFLSGFAEPPTIPISPRITPTCSSTPTSRDSRESRYPRAHTVRERALARLSEILATPGDGDEVRSRHRGRAATALVGGLGDPEAAWRLLGRGEDPGSRTELIHDLFRFGVDPRLVIARLAVEADGSARRALVLALGSYPVSRIPGEERCRITKILLDEYRDAATPACIPRSTGW